MIALLESAPNNNTSPPLHQCCATPATPRRRALWVPFPPPLSPPSPPDQRRAESQGQTNGPGRRAGERRVATSDLARHLLNDCTS